MEHSNLWNRINYKCTLPYIINTYIREYDLSKANISSLYHYNVLSKEQYESFLNMPKQEREIKIGLMIRNNKSYYDTIANGITYAKRMLIETNNVQDYEIVSIKNDAIFIHGRELQNSKFGIFEFKVKNTFTTYMRLSENIEIYYYDFNNNDTIQSSITVKGISDENLISHNDGMLNLINQVCFMINRYDVESILSYVTDMYNDFRDRSLPINYYRSFDSMSKFMIRTEYFSYILDYIDDTMRGILDISVNDSVFRELIYIIYDIYNSRYKK